MGILLIFSSMFLGLLKTSFSTEELFFSLLLCLQVFPSASVTVLLQETIRLQESLLMRRASEASFKAVIFCPNTSFSRSG